MKKFLVLGILFILPIVVYLFFASGVNNFMKLPVITEGVSDVNTFKTFSDDPVGLQAKISVLGFLGSDTPEAEAMAFNLNQKIYKRFYEFNDFQFVMMVPEGNETLVKDLRDELGQLSDISKWRFVFASPNEIEEIYNSLQTGGKLSKNGGSRLVFIIDKEGNLRGRREDKNVQYGYDATSVAELNNNMIDDVKVILAEYRLALKKNNAYREK